MKTMVNRVVRIQALVRSYLAKKEYYQKLSENVISIDIHATSREGVNISQWWNTGKR